MNPMLAGLAFLAANSLASGTKAPAFTEGTWINGPPETAGKVVLVEFWTFGCWNCANVEPYVKEWHAKYAEKGLVVVGIHTPELDHEKKVENVRAYVKEKELLHSILIDTDYANWRRWNQRFWPVIYLLDRKGVIRYVKIGEGRYDETEKMIRTLLAEK